MNTKPITVSEYNRALQSGHWIEYGTVEEAMAAVEAKAKRYRQFMKWEIYGHDGKKLAEVCGQH